MQTTTPAVRMPRVEVDQLLHAILPLWPLVLVIVAAIGARLAFWIRSEFRLRRSGIGEIDRMSGSDFERRLAVLFHRLGSRAEVVGSAAGDYGADLVLEKGGLRTVVQAKRWNQTVGVAAVQEIVAARPYYRADAAMVVTTSRFSQQAQRLARANGVSLWDRETLIGALLQADQST